MLDALLGTGLFGHSAEDAIDRMVCEKLRQLAEEGWFELERPLAPPRPSRPPSMRRRKH